MQIGSFNAGFSVRPMNYAIENGASFSQAYTESVKNEGKTMVKSVAPVRYPDAQLVKDTNSLRTESATRSVETNRAYNAIAANYGNAVTSYSGSGAGMSFSMVGSSFDAFA